jgi:NAD(P)-dependent dehydrogenase (short-subunit alcohol dehydrogenase family)
MTERTWFITGANRGLGRAFTEAALGAGDRVVATARAPEGLRDELTEHRERAFVVQLDVTDSAAARRAVTAAIERFGTIDILVNNAGYGLSGGIEEITEAQARAQFDTNFFGPMWLVQAMLPHMRERGSGHIIQISSLAGVITSANLGVYCASKWALEAMSEALAQEAAPFGIKVSIVEPSGFRTDWAGSSMERAAPLDCYDDVLAPGRDAFDVSQERTPPGDPALAARGLLAVVESAAPPLRVPFGNQAYDVSVATHRSRIEALGHWEDLARSVDAPLVREA